MTRPTPRRRAPLLAVLYVGVFLGAIDAHLVNVAFPDMLGSFPSSDLAELSWGVGARKTPAADVTESQLNTKA